ncbi:hypothetical protein [Oscillatoria sp. FACHB-1407]
MFLQQLAIASPKTIKAIVSRLGIFNSYELSAVIIRLSGCA